MLQFVENRFERPNRLVRRMPRACGGWFAILFLVCTSTFQLRAQQQEVRVWEYAPYQVEIWYYVAPSVDMPEDARQRWANRVEKELRRAFKATWRIQMKPLPRGLAPIFSRRLDDFKLEEITSNELVLVTSIESEEAATIRTFEAALESLSSVVMSPGTLEQLRSAAERTQATDDPQVAKLLELADVTEETPASLASGLQSGQVAAALVPRSQAAELEKFARVLLTLLPWQTDAIFRRLDKLFFVTVSQEGNHYNLSSRELDCPMQFLGPAFSQQTSHWPYAARTASKVIQRSFAPVARVEDAEFRSAELTLRAGGLILDESNPAKIRRGDVLQPIIRRDNRNGIPTLLEPLPWTYAAVTRISGVNLQANVYTYSGGPGLQGRQNRRTQRVVLRVRPQANQTNIQITVRGSSQEPQPGCLVYSKDFITDEFELLGRTDWRGQLPVAALDQPTSILPADIKQARLAAKRAAEAEALKQKEQNAEQQDKKQEKNEQQQPSQSADEDQIAGSSSGDQEVQPTAQSTSSAGKTITSGPGEPQADAKQDPQLVHLNAPLIQLYVKSGDQILAKLPLVPGISELELAELPDDSRRLQAEAFVRGFQGEILDLIGLRNLLAARIRLAIEKEELPVAKDYLEQLRKLKNYSEMSDRLQEIQRRMLDESEATISRTAKSRMDRMFQTTRTMLQKYLQDDLVSQSEQLVRTASPNSS